MRERKLFEVGIERFFVCALAVFALVLLLSSIGLAYERDIILGEEYHTEKERYKIRKEPVSFKDRFSLDLNFGIGGYYGGCSNLQIFGRDPKINTYVKNLGMDYSENADVVRLTATYFVTPKLTVYIGVPFGVVTLAQLFKEDELKAGVGDIYGGLAFTLLSGTEAIPNIAVFLNVDADTSKYYSLGDGLWDYTIGTQVNQLLFKSFYIFGMRDYTYRLEKKNIEPGNIAGYGGGVGFLSGQIRIEAGLRAYKYDETKFNNTTLFEKSDDLAFNLKSITSFGIGKISSMNLIVGNLDEGFEFGKDPITVEFSIPIF